MTEKIGLIKNPLTIIAIFAGIAEVCGTTVLPFVTDDNQLTFIYFLIAFPSALVIIFFITLNFNNKALYAPSDFTDEENYIKIFKYDISRQEKVEVKVTSDELIQILNENFSEFKKLNFERLSKIENEFKSLKEKNEIPTAEVVEDAFIINEEINISISNFRNSVRLKNIFLKKGYHNIEIYLSPGDSDEKSPYSDYANHQSIWLGERVPYQTAIDIITTAKNYYPHLIYIDLSERDYGAPDYIHDSIYIGGATETAIEYMLKPMNPNDFTRLSQAKSNKELQSIIKEFK